MRVAPAFLPFLLALAACNSRPATTPTTQADVTVTAQLPGGTGCSSAIARYRAVAKSDADTGNAGEAVYRQIDGEIRGAEAACAAGRDGEALRLIAASKARHGYPSGN